MNILESIVLLILGSIIGYLFSKKTEAYKFELIKREQAVKVAELFAFWLTCDDESLAKYTPEDRIKHCEKLNKMVWELAIWIPDECIVKDIMDKLSHKSPKDIKDIIISMREQIQGHKNEKLKSEDIVNFK
jgi:hypothetical protein